MPEGFSVDASDFSRLAADLGSVPPRSGPNLRTAIEVTARHVKDDWRENARGSEFFPDYPNAITYDIEGSGNRATGSNLTAEIGPDARAGYPGNWGALLEYGGARMAPRGAGHRALQTNQADFERGIDVAIDSALREAGL